MLSSCVIGLPDEDYGNVVHAIVELPPGAGVTDEDLRAHLAARLVGYKLPRTFERTDGRCGTTAGKVRRSALRAERCPGRVPGESRPSYTAGARELAGRDPVMAELVA